MQKMTRKPYTNHTKKHTPQMQKTKTHSKFTEIGVGNTQN